jgi:hypothetical protein
LRHLVLKLIKIAGGRAVQEVHRLAVRKCPNAYGKAQWYAVWRAAREGTAVPDWVRFIECWLAACDGDAERETVRALYEAAIDQYWDGGEA